MPMKRPIGALVDLNSSAISRVSYDQSHKQLHVEFRDGSAYGYLDVPSAVYGELLNAESQGTYFNRRIRNAYSCVGTSS